MQIAVVAPEYQAANDKPGWCIDALNRLGHTAFRCTNLSGVIDADASSDVLLFMQASAGLNRVDLVAASEARKARWVQWYWDLIYREPGKPLAQQVYVSGFLDVMRAMDLVLVKERGLISEYRQLGVPASWCWQAAPSWLPEAGVSSPPRWDILLWGTSRGYDQRFADAAAVAKAGYRVAWATSQGPVPAGVEPVPWQSPGELPSLAGQATLVLSVDYADVEGYCSDRLFLAGGMGCCVLHRTGYDAPFNGLWSYETQADLLDAARLLLGEPALVAATRNLARQQVMAEHTYERRLGQLLSGVFDGDAADHLAAAAV